MNIVQEAFYGLYPNRQFNYNVDLKYSARFADYNANVRLAGFYNLSLGLSKKWKGVDREIQIGLMQDLLYKVFGGKKVEPTVNMKLYNSFIKNLHLGISKDKVDDTLKRSFDRINERFFGSQVDLCNLVWGTHSKRKLGSYNYHTDTISMSKIFQESDVELLDYVMYHEMLHKFMKFTVGRGRHTYHTSDFRKAEKLYPNNEELERRIRYMPTRKKVKSGLFGWFGS